MSISFLKGFSPLLSYYGTMSETEVGMNIDDLDLLDLTLDEEHKMLQTGEMHNINMAMSGTNPCEKLVR